MCQEHDLNTYRISAAVATNKGTGTCVRLGRAHIASGGSCGTKCPIVTGVEVSEDGGKSPPTTVGVLLVDCTGETSRPGLVGELGVDLAVSIDVVLWGSIC